MSFLKSTGLLVLLLTCTFSYTVAQVGINTDGSSPNASSMLDITSSDKGMLTPRMTTTQRNAITNPATGLLVYDTNTGSFWYYENAQWNELGTTLEMPFTEPVLQATMSIGDENEHMILQEEVLFILDNDANQLITVDISEPSNPIQLGQVNFGGSQFALRDLAINGNYAYIPYEVVENFVTTSAGLIIVAISDPSAMTYTTLTTGDYVTCYADQDVLYLLDNEAEELQLFDIADGASPTPISTLGGFPAGSSRYYGLTVKEGYAYVFHSQIAGSDAAQISIVDVSNTQNPSITGALTSNVIINSLADHPYRLQQHQGYLFLSSTSETIRGAVYDVSDPTTPTYIDYIGGSDRYPTGFDIAGNNLFTGDGISSPGIVAVFDISDPANQSLLYSADFPTSAIRSITTIVEKTTLYILTREDLIIYNIGEKFVEVAYPDGTISFENPSDDLGNHTATQNIQLGGSWLSNDGEDEGIFIDDAGQVGIGKNDPQTRLDVEGTVTATGFSGDGAGLSNIAQQSIDTFSLSGTTLAISLENDGVASSTLDLSSINTDDQAIDKLNLSGTTLQISLEDDGQSDQTVDLASLNTDEQTIDKLNLDGTTLELSLEGDGQADQTVSLASLDTDDQTLSFSGTTLSITDGNSVDLSSLVPIGTIQMWPTSTPPSGWLLCDGSGFSDATYPDLETVLGSTDLPDFRGRFPLAVNTDANKGTIYNLGITGGEETHVLTVDEMPSHSHGISYTGRNKSGSGGEVSDLESSGSTTTTESTGGGQAHNNMPPYYPIHFIIKAK